MESRQYLRSVRKTLSALAYLNVRPQVTVSELAKWIKVPRTTAHRILETLVAEKFAASDKSRRATSYRLTDKVLSLSAGFDVQQGITSVAEPILKTLRARIGWSLTLSTVIGDHVLVRYTTDRDTAVTINRSHVGAQSPILHTASGQCYLAFCEKQECEILIQLAAASEDPHQVLARTPDKLRVLLGHIRKAGYRLIEYPNYPEASLAVPIFVNKRVVAGLVMRYVRSAVPRHMVLKQYLPHLEKAAREIGETYQVMVDI